MEDTMNIFNLFVHRFTKVRPMPAGVYQKRSAAQDQLPYRIYLRLEPDGSGVLVVNAATVLQLNRTAAEYAYHFVQGTSPEMAAKEISTRYRISRDNALEHYTDFAARMERLANSTDLDPVSYLDFERVPPHSAKLSAPLRLDCALTYRLVKGEAVDYTPTKQIDRELTTDEWLAILDKAWQVGIPHVTFTGGEATVRDDLPDLIARAEKNGQVCGLLTDGLKLVDKNYLEILRQTGLDHILFVLEPGVDDTWKALTATLSEDIFVTVHFTLREENENKAREILEKLANLGVKNLSLSTADPNLREPLKKLQNQAASLGMALKFDLPVPNSAEHPVAHETALDAVPEGAGQAWLYVEPDGDVLPSQGMADKVLGNILRDPWDKIYQRQ
jgi:Radical SAM superfamily